MAFHFLHRQFEDKGKQCNVLETWKIALDSLADETKPNTQNFVFEPPLILAPAFFALCYINNVFPQSNRLIGNLQRYPINFGSPTCLKSVFFLMKIGLVWLLTYDLVSDEKTITSLKKKITAEK